MNRTEPIRKPFRKTKCELKQHQRKARLIDARIFQSDGKLYLSTGTPRFSEIWETLSKLTPQCLHDRETLRQIAFTCAREGQLTRGMLNEINHSVTYWKKHLIENRRDQRLRREFDEVVQLEKRVKFCFAQQKYEARKSQFALTPLQIAELNGLAKNADPDLNEFELCLLRIVYWFSGKRAAERFVDALTCTTDIEVEKLNQVDSMLAWLQTLQLRSVSQPDWILRHEFKNCETFKNLIKWAKSVSCVWRKCNGSLHQKIEAATENLNRLREMIVRVGRHEIPTTLAAWTICDRGTSFLPRCEIRDARIRMCVESLKKTAQQYIVFSNFANYDRWLDLIKAGKLPDSQSGRFAVFRILYRDVSVCDALYVMEATEPTWIGFDVDMSQARQLVVRIRRVMKIWTGQLPDGLNNFLFSSQGVRIGRRIFDWLDSFPPSAISPRVRRILLRLFEETSSTFGSAVVGPIVLKRIKPWADRQSARRTPFQHEVQWPAESRQWLRRLRHYQQLAGEESRVPNSLKRPAALDAKRSRELAYLKSRRTSGTLTPNQQHRLSHLCSDKPQPRAVQRFVDEAQDACLLQGLTALRAVFTEASKEIWIRATDYDVDGWSMPRWIAMSGWVCQMSPREKSLLKQTVAAWKKHGNKYKRHLPFNEAWITNSRSKFKNLKYWLMPKPLSIRIGLQRIELRVVTSPIETYFMGTYFNTCLSQGGCYEMAVLANAAHVNKQVVYATTKDGTVIARQLIAINKDYKLIGFYTYMNLGDTGIDRDSLTAQFTAFAKQISDRCGIALAKSRIQLFLNHSAITVGTTMAPSSGRNNKPTHQIRTKNDQDEDEGISAIGRKKRSENRFGIREIRHAAGPWLKACMTPNKTPPAIPAMISSCDDSVQSKYLCGGD